MREVLAILSRTTPQLPENPHLLSQSLDTEIRSTTMKYGYQTQTLKQLMTKRTIINIQEKLMTIVIPTGIMNSNFHTNRISTSIDSNTEP